MWDGGKDWLTGGLAKVYPKRRGTAAAWAARLAPSACPRNPGALTKLRGPSTPPLTT